MDALIVLVILRRGLYKTWPSVLTYCLVSLVVDASACFHGCPYAVRYYRYWGWIGLSSAMRIWVMDDVIRAAKGADYLKARLRAFFLSAGSAAAVGCSLFALLDTGSQLPGFARFAIQFETAVSAGLTGFVVVLLASMWFLNLTWSRAGIRITGGIALKCLCGLFASYLLQKSAEGRDQAPYVIATAACLNLLFWLFALVRPNGSFVRHSSTPLPLFGSYKI